MTKLHADLEALMPEPAGVTTIAIYPDHEGRVEAFSFLPEGTDLFTADQVREAMQAATERAAKLSATLAYDAAIKYANGREVDFEQEVGDAIRAASMHEGGGKTP